MADEHEIDADAHRPSEATQLRDVIASHRAGLAICAISGAGGIGKSYLVDHVLSSIDPAGRDGWSCASTQTRHKRVATSSH